MTKDEDLLISLYNLAKRINSHGGKLEESMVERYKYFVEHSEHKQDCSYARKCRELFLNHDYEDIKVEFLKVLDLIRVVEGVNWGK